MAISSHPADNEKQKFKEASAAFRQPGIVVVNPDGSSIGSTNQTPGSVGDGRKTAAAAGTAEALASSTSIKSVVITAETDNTGVIVVGGSLVSGISSRSGVSPATEVVGWVFCLCRSLICAIIPLCWARNSDWIRS
jgi:hypothetical protein